MRYLNGTILGVAAWMMMGAVMTGAARGEDRPQLRTLGATDKPRFEVKDRDWPASADKPSVCLWKDDKMAAFCFGVDDDWFADTPWWLEQQQKFGYPCTWFLITGNIGSNSFHGKWEDWQKIVDAGNDVQSHTVTHLHIDAADYKGVEWDYSQAVKDIETNLPKHKVYVLAYPGGKNSSSNSRELAEKYYVCARGTRGVLNSASGVDYLNVNATRLHVGDNPKAGWADARQLLDPESKNFRGWGFYFTHKVERDKCLLVMQYMHEHDADMWVGLFADQARYGQERDTAEIVNVSANAKQVTFDLRDKMDDGLFDYPLTIKVRLPEGWTNAAATQNDKLAEVKVIEHEGVKYALVSVVPDRGTVTMIAK